MPTAKKRRTLNDLYAEHDDDVLIPGKITAALKALAKEGPEQHETDTEFSRRAGVSNTQLGAYREQFRKHFIVLAGRNGKRYWFGNPEAAKKARIRLNLSE